MTTRRPTARRGFTLLEIILAMAIAATISLVLYTPLSTAFKARASVLNQTSMMREASCRSRSSANSGSYSRRYWASK